MASLIPVIFILMLFGPNFVSSAAPEIDKYQHIDDDNELLMSNTGPVDRQEIVVDILRGSPATNNNDDRHRSLQYDDGCPDSLSTPLNPTSGSYGNVFSVRTVEGGPSVLEPRSISTQIRTKCWNIRCTLYLVSTRIFRLVDLRLSVTYMYLMHFR